MMDLIVIFLRGRSILVSAFVVDFHLGCRSEAIFQSRYSWSWSNWVVTNFGSARNFFLFLVSWDTWKETIALPEDKTTRVDTWVRVPLVVKPPRRI